jgi:sugar phosphate permease
MTADSSSPLPPNDSHTSPTKRRWVIFALACGTSFLLYLHRFTFNFIGPKLKEEYGFNDTQIGTLGSLFNWTYGSLQIPSGIAADFFGPHFFLGTIMAVWSIALAMHGFGQGFYSLGAVRLLFGIGQAGAYPSLSNVTQSWFPQSGRTIIQGWVATFFGRGGGFMSSVLFATVLMGWCGLSWRTALVVLSALGLLFAVCFLALFRSSPAADPSVNEAELALIHEGQKPVSDRRVLPWGRALSHRSMWFFIAQQLTSAGADNVYGLFMGGFFLTVKGIDLSQAGLLVGLPLLGGAIGGMLGGFCNDWLIAWTGSRRWGRSLVGFTGKFLACLLMFVAISQENAAAAGWALFVVKFFSDWSQPTVWGTCTDLGGKCSASVFAMINTAGTIGGIICPPLFGLVLDSFPEQVTLRGEIVEVPGYTSLFTVIAGMYIVSAVCWFMIDCTKSLENELLESDASEHADSHNT